MNKERDLMKRFWVLGMVLLLSFGSYVLGAEDEFALFDVEHRGEPDPCVPVIEPWKVVELDPEYSGRWLVSGDLDQDGAAEVLTARVVFNGDSKEYTDWYSYTSAVVAQRLDGSVLWHWGDPTVGRRMWYGNAACRIYDWDRDGEAEVIVGADKVLLVLDGKTGQVERQFPIPAEASDDVIFCRLQAGDGPDDILLKTTYTRIWAFNYAGKQMWESRLPGGCKTAHQPQMIDLDHDGTPEVVAGFGTLKADGSPHWLYRSPTIDVNRWKGHMDCIRVVTPGSTPEDMRLVLTCCGANNIAMINGLGETIWEINGPHWHFESADVGDICPESPGPEILVDLDHREPGDFRLWVLSNEGKRLGQFTVDYGRHHRLMDWDGDGYDDVILTHARGVFNGKGQRIATFACPAGKSSVPGDMNGDGVSDLIITSETHAYIFTNPRAPKAGEKPGRLGCPVNFSLY